jgi:hypothetical protein
MGGKASIYMVLGFSLIFLVASMNYGRLTGSAVDNNVEYYKSTVAHNIAVSGANMAANQIFIDKTWTAGYKDLPFSSGIINVKVEDAGQQKKRITSTGEFQGVTKKVVIDRNAHEIVARKRFLRPSLRPALSLHRSKSQVVLRTVLDAKEPSTGLP